jgi:cadmium resistance protein CadD (predicted permease)
MLETLGIGIVVFAFAHIDDLFVIAAFFADKKLKRIWVVLGQVIGTAGLVAVSAAAAQLAVDMEQEWVALVGFVPLLLGVRKLIVLRRAREDDDVEGSRKQLEGHIAGRRLRAQVLAIAAVAISNGADDLGLYIPLFASSVKEITSYAGIFLVMSTVWCGIAYLLVHNPLLGKPLRRYGHRMLPFVLIGVGLFVLWDALPLLTGAEADESETRAPTGQFAVAGTAPPIADEVSNRVYCTIRGSQRAICGHSSSAARQMIWITMNSPIPR